MTIGYSAFSHQTADSEALISGLNNHDSIVGQHHVNLTCNNGELAHQQGAQGAQLHKIVLTFLCLTKKILMVCVVVFFCSAQCQALSCGELWLNLNQGSHSVFDSALKFCTIVVGSG